MAHEHPFLNSWSRGATSIRVAELAGVAAWPAHRPASSHAPPPPAVSSRPPKVAIIGDPIVRGPGKRGARWRRPAAPSRPHLRGRANGAAWGKARR